MEDGKRHYSEIFIEQFCGMYAGPFFWLCSTQLCFLGLSRNSVSTLILFNKPFLLKVGEWILISAVKHPDQ